MNRVYIAGPMTGYPDLNREEFAHAADALTQAGHSVINPHLIPPWQHDGECPRSYAINPDGHAAACYLRSCLRVMLLCDEVALLPRWEASVGARTEFDVAAVAGLRISYR